MRAIKSNMREQVGLGPGYDDRKILRCPECGMEWSGNAGDYWQYPDDHVFTCDECKCELELVTKVVSVKYVQ